MITLHAVPEGDPPARQTPWLARLYMAAWGVLAGCALVYLALVLARPDLASALIGQPKNTASATDKAEMEGVRQGVSALRSEVAALRAETAARDGRDLALATRLAALEAATPKGSDAAENTPAARAQDVPLTTASVSTTTEKPVMLSGTTIQGKVEDKPTKSPPRPAVAIVQPVPPATATDQQRAPAQTAAVRIASGPSLDALRLSWQLLLEGHRPVLKPLEPRWIPMPGEATSFALLAGPVASPEDAAKICAGLKAKRITCSVTRFGGQPL